MTASYQPHRRGRPVVVPNSPPTVAQAVARGVVELGRERALATRVEYALMTAMTLSTRVGGMPEPVHAPPAVAELDVTNG
jgi:hypothetical protein